MLKMSFSRVVSASPSIIVTTFCDSLALEYSKPPCTTGNRISTPRAKQRIPLTLGMQAGCSSRALLAKEEEKQEKKWPSKLEGGMIVHSMKHNSGICDINATGLLYMCTCCQFDVLK